MEPVGQGAMPVVAIVVEMPTELSVPTSPPPGQYERAVQFTGVF
jgi:hypothetical protein